MAQQACTHLEGLEAVEARTPEGCEECIASGDTWVHLRMCLSCGHVGCCDNSKNRHATGHHQDVGHPVVESFQPDEDWKWCYVDQTFAR